MLHIEEQALTFDDVLLVPKYSSVLPQETDLSTKLTKQVNLKIPIVSAAMDTVTESRMSIALAELGGIGIIHKNISIADQAKEVSLVKKFESGVVRDPITISSKKSVGELIKLTQDLNISGMPVVNDGDLVGIVTSRDFRNVSDLSAPVESIMTPKKRLVTAEEDAKLDIIKNLLYKNRIEKILLVDKSFALKGLVTLKDINKNKDFPLASKDTEGRLLVGAAVGNGEETDERVDALVEAGVDVLVVDSAHGHSQNVIDTVKLIKKNFPNQDVIAGNVASADGAKALLEAGADSIKIGMGPGSICTTRIVAGIGVPQISAILEIKEAINGQVPLIADGGIRYSGDIAKAIAAGADAVMLGSIFAGTEEAPGEIELYQGRSFKTYRGMGSIAAMAKQDDSNRYMQEGIAPDKLVPEGVEGRVPYKGWVISVINQLVGGLRQSMGYVGCKTITAMQEDSKFVEITNAGMAESHVHDVQITKEAPNYQRS